MTTKSSQSAVTELDQDPKGEAGETGGKKSAVVEKEEVREIDARNAVNKLSGKRQFVTIAAGESDDSKYAVPLSLNGEMMLVPRGVKVSIPVEYFEILRNSVKTVYSANLDTKGQIDGVDTGQQVPRFSFLDHGPDNSRLAA